MKFSIEYSQQAFSDLQNIHNYISNCLQSPTTAKRVNNEIMSSIETLDEMPNRFPLYDKEPWRSRGVRKLLINNFIAFYLLDEEQNRIIILAIMYAKRDIENILKK